MQSRSEGRRFLPCSPLAVEPEPAASNCLSLTTDGSSDSTRSPGLRRVLTCQSWQVAAAFWALSQHTLHAHTSVTGEEDSFLGF